MAKPKKYGTFAGVFTPSVLTILGVIMYMRLSWVVGNAGLWGTLLIIFFAHIISFTTGLSISSISTDKKVGAGGVYYVLSRSLGLPIGGAIGVTLFVGTAFGIALYLIGFAESFNAYIGMDTSLNGYRLTAGLALLSLTILAFISTSIALKTQFFILLAIIFSLFSIFFGTSDNVPEVVHSFGGEGAAPMETVFAIFFPAVTGFTAGVAMSGDLKDSKKAIPRGTMLAIFTGLIVYVSLTLFIAYNIDTETLTSDFNILVKIAYFSPLVVAGIWGATISSALGGILGGPRILQAMSIDKITPKIFAAGQGKNNEPRLALILTVIIAFAGILIGELNLIARLVSMFYLAAYGFINLSFFLESWASSDFKPSFKVNKWVGFVGFVVTFIIMFKLDMLAMFASFIVIGGIYLWLSKKAISLGEGDIWQSVWTNVVKRGLKSLDDKEDHKRNWKPNILLFSGKQKARVHLLEFSRFLAGKMGIITNFNLIENKESGELFAKQQQSYSDELLEEFNVFGRQLEVNNVYEGIGTIASVFGFSGIEPNTVLMGWARNSEEPEKLSELTNKLINLDYNVLFLDYDKDKEFGNYDTIDLWWRGISSNAELSLMLVKLLVATPEWGNAKIRIILVNNIGNDHRLIKKRIENLIDTFRVKAEVFIINNYADKKSIYSLMKIHSGETSLLILGVPHIVKGEEGKFVEQVNDLVDVLGTTLLVKASSKFEVADLGVDSIGAVDVEEEKSEDLYLPRLKKLKQEQADGYIKAFDGKLKSSVVEFRTGIIDASVNRFLALANELDKQFSQTIKDIGNCEEKECLVGSLNQLEENYIRLIDEIIETDIPAIKDIIETGIREYMSYHKDIFGSEPYIINIDADGLIRLYSREEAATVEDKSSFVQWRELLKLSNTKEFNKEFYAILLTLLDTGLDAFGTLRDKTHEVFVQYIEKAIRREDISSDELSEFEEQHNEILKEFVKNIKEIRTQTAKEYKFYNRNYTNTLVEALDEDRSIRSYKKTVSRNDKRMSRVFGSRIQEFGMIWEEVVRDMLNAAKVDFALDSIYLQIVNETYAIKEKLEHEVLEPIDNVLVKLDKAVKKINSGKENLSKFALLPADYSLEKADIDVEDLLTYLHTNIGKHIKKLQDEAELLSIDTLSDINKKVLEDISKVEIPLKKVANHILSDDLLSNFKVEIDKLQGQVEEFKNKANSIFNLLNYTYGANYDEAQSAEIENLNKTIEKDLTETRNGLSFAKEEFYERFYQLVHQLSTKLKSEYIIENISELHLHLKKVKRTNKIEAAVIEGRDSLKQKFNSALDFISRKNEDVRRFEIGKMQDKYLPEHIKLNKELSTLKVKKNVVELLPFYYHQIFNGRHYGIHTFAENRKIELNKALEAIEEIKLGAKGALLIGGESGVGKSFFIENLFENLNNSSIVRINVENYKSKSPLESAINKIRGRKGSVDYLINGFKRGTVFVFEDIERYITLKEKNKALLDVINDLIDKHSSKYLFVLSANSNALKTIDSLSNIMGGVYATIILGSLNYKQIQDIILDRHYSGDLELYNSKAEEVSDKELIKVIKNIYSAANGNPGVALHLWLASMQVKDDKLFIDENADFSRINITNSNWLSILNRLVIFGQIPVGDVDRVFNSEMKDSLSILCKIGLVDKSSYGVYIINRGLKPFVERWLKIKEIL